MVVTELEITGRAPFAGGQPFGEAGAYERVDGVLRFAVDPLAAANARIVDLALAPRDASGRVIFEADFCLLQPADPAKGSGSLLFDVPNRGNRPANQYFNRAPILLEPTDAIDPGDAFLFRRGWSLAWCGWQWEVPRGEVPGVLGLEAPLAFEAGAPVRGQVCVEAAPDVRVSAVPLRDGLGMVPFRPYPAADLQEPGAQLWVQDHPEGPRALIPRDRWRFARDEAGQPVPDAAWAWLEGGFEPGKTYDVVYTTAHAPVVGAGLLAVRDCVSFLRYATTDDGNPAAGRIAAAFGFGISQSGRFLRQFLYEGLNADEAGRTVFDGVLAHVAGGRRGEFNHRFGQPSVEVTPGFGHLPPFADGPAGDAPGLLARQAAIGQLPKVVYTNSASEYWRGDGSLAHIGADGQDLELPGTSRSYLFASCPHAAGFPVLTKVSALPGGPRATMPFNILDYRPLLRAALVNLEAWARDGVEPPPSAIPRLGDGTAVTREAALAATPRIPGMAWPAVAALRHVPDNLALGPRAAEGIGAWPAKSDGVITPFVSALDADGNEAAGIRLPDVAEPVATHLGWNTRDPGIGGEGQLVRYVCATLPFAATRAGREATGDPRPSLEERYGSRAAYDARVRAAAESLVRARHLLPEDVNVAVHAALRRWDLVRNEV